MSTHILLTRHFTIVARADAHARVKKVLCKEAIYLFFIALLENNSTSETDLNYYHQKVSVRVASRVAERLKT